MAHRALSESCESSGSPESPLKIDNNTQLYTIIDNLQKIPNQQFTHNNTQLVYNNIQYIWTLNILS